MTDTVEKLPFVVRMGHWVFPRRLLIPLPAIALALIFFRPKHIYGRYELLGLLFSGLLVAAGVGLRIWAGGCAGDHTRTDTIGAPQLATNGPYAYVRNPIYLGNLILGLGMIGLMRDPRLLVLYALIFPFLYVMIVPAEEQFLRERFGKDYERYCDAVPRMIPRLSRWRGAARRSFDWMVLRGEAWIVFYLVVIYAAMRVAERLHS
jgi:protein-S-isoprenylcysteine O-methyltransferase Ste14